MFMIKADIMYYDGGQNKWLLHNTLHDSLVQSDSLFMVSSK